MRGGYPADCKVHPRVRRDESPAVDGEVRAGVERVVFVESEVTFEVVLVYEAVVWDAG